MTKHSNSRELWLRLLYANSEDEVSTIVNSDMGMKNPTNWQPLDDRDTNFNVVTNQSSNGGKAATELITNMVDAMLIKQCLIKKIDPKSDKAPKTMYAAVDKFIQQLSGGKIINADEGWLRKFSSENLVIGVVGSRAKRQRPCYLFCDNGEGQHPDKFPDTFLSLSAKNKSEIPFVQGKYNMGSSGVLNFCGKFWYKLIISRRYDKTGEWGWTLIRRNTSGMGYAEYYAPSKVIQTAGKNSIFPFQTGKGDMFRDFSLETGTVIKLYEYHTGARQEGFRASREVFNENLVETILPFRIMDFRWHPDPARGGLRSLGIDERPLYGMEFLLAKTHSEDKLPADDTAKEIEAEEDNEEYRITPISTASDPSLGKIIVTAIKLKKDSTESWAKHSRNRVFHHVNGQVQFKNTRGFLSQCKLDALKDRVVIFVDASNLKDDAHHRIWKGDRESIIENSQGEAYKSFVKSLIAKSEDLKELNHQIAKEELDSVAKDSARDLVKELVTRDKNFALLLDGKTPDVVGPPKSEPKPQQPRGDLKYSPTYVKLKTGQREFETPSNKPRTILCDTNARDDFFTRSDNRGQIILDEDAPAEMLRIEGRLNNGDLRITITPDYAVSQVGDSFKFKIGLIDGAMTLPVYTDEITIRIVPEVKTPTKPPSPSKTPSVGLPPYRLLTKDGRDIDGVATLKWEDTQKPNFNEKDGGYVDNLGNEEKIYRINYDNASFQAYFRSKKTDVAKRTAKEKFILGMRLLMLGLEQALNPDPHQERSKMDDDDYRRMAARGGAYVVLTLCEELPKVFDISGNQED